MVAHESAHTGRTGVASSAQQALDIEQRRQRWRERQRRGSYSTRRRANESATAASSTGFTGSLRKA